MNTNASLALLRPAWPAPPRVGAALSLRSGGVSVGAYASLNLAAHVGDDAPAVNENRRRLRAALTLPAEPLWLTQLHGTRVIEVDGISRPAAGPSALPASAPEADAAVTRQPGRVLAVLVADCLPVLFARADGGAVAVAHAGWRGLAAGVLEATVQALECDPEQLHAWIGPGIGAAHFEVGEQVRAAFCTRVPEAAEAFERNARGRWQCDLYRLALQRLGRLGVRSVHAERHCTYAESEAFFSYRRDGATGRMAALIWLAP